MLPTSKMLPIVLCIGLAGCTRNHYVIEIEPRSDGFQRRLTAWSETKDAQAAVSRLPRDELDRMRAAYRGQQASVKDEQYVFEGVFHDTVPNDLGGAGSYRVFESPIGTLSVYLERVRGSDDVQQRLLASGAKIDQAIDLLLGWTDIEIQDEAVRRRVHQLLNTEVRHDLHNLVLYCWGFRVAADVDAQSGVLRSWHARIGQYLVEHEYITPDQLPRIYRLSGGASERETLDFVRDVVARKMGLLQQPDLNHGLTFLSNPVDVRQSLQAYLRGTEFYLEQVSKWRQENRQEVVRHQQPPAPDEMLVDLFAEGLLGGPILGASDSLQVRIKLPGPPIETSGHWNKEKSTVEWDTMDNEGRPWPLLVFASWAVPNQQVQRAHFGRTVLEGQTLAEYVLWYRALNRKERTSWDHQLADVSPGDGLADRIKDLRLPVTKHGLAGDGDEVSDRAESIRDALLQAIQQAVDESP